jgi:iron complex transport system permease protein
LVSSSEFSRTGGGGMPEWLRGRREAVLLLLGLLLFLAMLLATAIGTVSIPLGHVLGIVAVRLHLPVVATWPATEESILWQLRLPRVVAAALVGAALATSGTLLQGLFRNPLADPFVLGISAGAGLAATVTVAVVGGAAAPAGIRWLGFGPVPLAAALGGLVAVLAVYHLARRGGQVPTARLLLAGFAVSSTLGAASTLLVVLSDRLLLHWRGLLGWLIGGVAVSGWTQVQVTLPLIALGLVLAWGLGPWLDALLLGEHGAAALGVPLGALTVGAVAVATLLTGAAVALAGLVGFVGLLVPHAVRLVLGPRHRILLPAAALAGAVFLTLADLVARTVLAPTELPVGAITALAGGPAFLWLLHRHGG